MKITAKQYAQVLFDLTKKKDSGDIDVIVLRFVKMLKKNRQINMLPKIIKKFIDIWNKEKGIVNVEVSSAEKLSVKNINNIKNFVVNYWRKKNKLNNNKKVDVNLINNIDRKIIGGIILKIGDEVLNVSIRRKIQNLEKQLKNN